MRFRYGADPLCLLACIAYGINQFGLKPRLSWQFLHTTFNDLLLIPAALPFVLWLQRRFRIRNHDGFPTWSEILLHWAIWSVICEGLGPRLFPWAIADPWDIAAYAIGALFAGVWWNMPRSQT